MDDLQKRIFEIENQIAELPQGYISKKNISGKIRYYHQWTEAGKKKSKYLNDVAAAALNPLIEKRRALQQELKTLNGLLPKGFGKIAGSNSQLYETNILTRSDLKDFIIPVQKYKKRFCFKDLQHYLAGGWQEKVFILYGLRRTGKTTLIRQAIGEMNAEAFSKTAFIQIRPGDTMAMLNRDLKQLKHNGFQYIFIDEVTFLEDFIQGAALFSDIYVAGGMKVILSGTDSLGFLLAEDEQLYDRCVLCHTTFIPYKEFETVLGIHGIDEYIRYGGTMSLSGQHYNDQSPFADKKRTDAYVDSAIAKNIQHSLKNYQDAGHFRHLQDLYEKNELTGAINRIVEDINHRFTVNVLTDTFKSHDLGISKRNLRHDREKPTDVLDEIDEETLILRLKTCLEILNKPEQRVEIQAAHAAEIKEYLELLDLVAEIPMETIPVQDDVQMQTIITQPGLRYAQVKTLVEQLLMDRRFQTVSAVERAYVCERILNEVRGRMLEEIILLETQMAYPNKKVFKLQFAVGEFDMVVADPQNITCEVYEIKHSKKIIADQYRHLIDEKKISDTAFRYGNVTKRIVLYRGETDDTRPVSYRNVEEYLMALPDRIL